MTAEIKNIALGRILPNPYRELKTYPWIEKKIEHLMRSIEDIGFWELIIVRPTKGGYEQAFGHHRMEALRALGIKTIPVIVRDLSDEEMIKFMGRENGEDYSSDMLVMLNTWEGAIRYLTSVDARKTQPSIEIAGLLGWTDMNKNGSVQLSQQARACASAYGLIKGGHLNRNDLRGLSMSSAWNLTERLQTRLETIEKAAAHKPKEEREQYKQHFVKAAKQTAQGVREGKIAQKDIRSRVDQKAMENAQHVKGKPIPDFGMFGRITADLLRKMLKGDAASERLAMIAKYLPHLTEEEDRGTIRMLTFELGELEERARISAKKITPNKVVNLVEKK